MRFFLLLKYIGGKKVIQFLRGQADKENYGKTINFVVPSNRTLQYYTPPLVIKESDKDIETIVQEFADRNIEFVGICWDEIDIRHGLLHLPSQGKLVGFTETDDYSVRNFLPVPDCIVKKKLGTKVVQFYLTSVDGKHTAPILSCSINSYTIRDVISSGLQRIDKLCRAKNIQPIYTASDGAKTNNKILKMYYTYLQGKFSVHFYDFLHTCKLIRNSWLSSFLMRKKDAVFGSSTLIKFAAINSKCNNLVDKMDQRTLMETCAPILTDALEGQPEIEYRECGRFLRKIHDYYHVFMDHNDRVNSDDCKFTRTKKKLKKLNSIVKYFTEWHANSKLTKNTKRDFITIDTFKQITTTCAPFNF